MYKKPEGNEVVHFSPSSDGAGSSLSNWIHGLPLRVPTNSNKNFTIRNIFHKRTPRKQYNAERYIVPSTPGKIVVNNYKKLLSDDAVFLNSKQNTPYGSNKRLDSEVNVFSFEPTQHRRRSVPEAALHRSIEKFSSIFDPVVLDVSLERVLKTINTFSHWDEEDIQNISSKIIFQSMRDKNSSEISRIRSLCGDYRVPLENMDIVKNRIIDGSLGYHEEVTEGIQEYVSKLVTHQQKLDADEKLSYTIKSRDTTLNEKFAISYAQQVMRELDPKKYDAPLDSIHEIYRSLSVDLDKRLPITTASSTLSSITVSLVETIKVIGSGTGEKTLTLKDGDFFNVDNGRGVDAPLRVSTEESHAFRLTDKDKERVLSILGVKDLVKLTAESPYNNAVEYTNDLNVDGAHPRSPFYFLKLNTSSITNPSRIKNHVDRTQVNYSLVSTDAEIDDWVKYNANVAFYTVEHDDIFLDYALSSTIVKATFKDFTFRTYGPKNNEDIPIIARNIPWSIVLIPTDKIELNPFKVRSHVDSFDSTGIMSRSILMAPHFDSRYSEESIDKFLAVSAIDDISENVFMEKNTSGAAIAIDSSKDLIASALFSGTAGERHKTPLRIVAEIINELSTNYTLKEGISWFDVLSRMSAAEFAKLFFLENSRGFLKAVENGLINETKLYHYYRGDNEIDTTGSRLHRKKYSASALDDVFFPIKLHTVRGQGITINPPTVSGGPEVEYVNINHADTKYKGTRITTRNTDVDTNVVANPEVADHGLGVP